MGHSLDDINATVLQGVLTKLILALFGMVILMMLMLNPPKDAASSTPVGMIQVEACWTGDSDIDLWSAAPGDYPVGFRRKDGKVFALLRDDLGSEGRPTEENCELSVARSVPSGEWVVNLHLYSSREKPPVQVKFSVVMRSPSSTVVIREGTISLRSVGDEQTAARFRINADGALIESSVGDIFTPMKDR